jgi:hypothetical protein
MRNSCFVIFLALAVLAMPCIALRAETLDSGASPTGPTSHGFALSLTPDNPVYYLGSPILVTVEVRNVSRRSHVGLFNSRNAGYFFNIVNALTRSVVPRNEHSAFGLVGGSFPVPQGGWPVPGGTSMYGKFRLDLLYNFRWPGIYSVQVVKGMPVIDKHRIVLQSNTLTLLVLP